MKIGDIVKMVDGYSHSEKLPNGEIFYDESSWRGIIVKAVDSDEIHNEWEVHWLHNPPNETSFEYGYYLVVISESR